MDIPDALPIDWKKLPELKKPLDALVIAPHPDDAELGMGGTIALMLKQGMEVGVVDLTANQPRLDRRRYALRRRPRRVRRWGFPGDSIWGSPIVTWKPLSPIAIA
jgi:hypothetical protein